MFKLESYITPLLLSYVDKYIKNLKPEDSQVSLWGGDAVFTNLDLRLDVLEQELKLPFIFVNGHIHELRIHVPWTKLGSESVVITINTIECIVKLHDSADDTSSTKSSSASIKVRGEPKRTGNKALDAETVAPPSYVQNLLNRVVNNITVVCNNVILKYVEEDMVLSLNVKSLCANSANEKWEAAFVDVPLSMPILRKLVHLHDLTVCLDRMNSSGKIDTYQDPLLYHCSLDCRVHMAFSKPTSKKVAITRVNILCEKLDFSITDQQLPMFVRLLELCLALYYNDLTGSSNAVVSAVQGTEEDGEKSEAEVSQEEEGWSSWMWSYVWPGEEDISQETSLSDKNSAILHFGIYIARFMFTFKVANVSEKNVHLGPARFSFTPVAKLYQAGVFLDMMLRGDDFVNVQMGIDQLKVTAVGECVCSVWHESDSSLENPISCCEIQEETFFKIGLNNSDANRFVKDSLFDDAAPENHGQSREYFFDWDTHFAKLPDSKLLDRADAIAFDYFYLIDLPNDWTEKSSSVSVSDLEYSNLHERTEARVWVGPIEFDVNSDAVHRLQWLFHAAQQHEYTPYGSRSENVEVIEENNLQPTEEEIRALETFIPFKTFNLSFIRPMITVRLPEHQKLDFAQPRVLKRRKKLKPGSRHSSKVEKKQSANGNSIVIYAEFIDVKFMLPKYPCRVVKTASLLSNPSEVLLHHCYSYATIKVMGCATDIHEVTAGRPKSTHSLLQPCNVILQQKSVLCGNLWQKNTDQVANETSVQVDSVHLCASVTDIWMAVQIPLTWLQTKTLEKNSYSSTLLNSQNGKSFLELIVTDASWKTNYTEKYSAFTATVAALTVNRVHDGNVIAIVNGPEKYCMTAEELQKSADFFSSAAESSSREKSDKLLVFTAQYSKNSAINTEMHAVVAATLEKFAIVFAVDTIEWLVDEIGKVLGHGGGPASGKHLEGDVSCGSFSKEDTDPSSQIISNTESYYKGQSSSTGMQKTTIIDMPKDSDAIVMQQSLSWLSICKNLVVQICMEGFSVIVPYRNFIVGKKREQIWQSVHHQFASGCLVDTVFINWPRLKLMTSSKQDVVLGHIIPIKKVGNWSLSEGVPWIFNMADFCIYSVHCKKKIISLVKEWAASATVALNVAPKPNQQKDTKKMNLCVHVDLQQISMQCSDQQMRLVCKLATSIADCANRLREMAFSLKNADFNLTLPMNTTNKSNIESETRSSKDQYVNVSLWMQITIPRFVAEFVGTASEQELRLTFEMEDVSSSIDVQDIYSKINLKISTLNATHYISKDGEWQTGPYKGITLCCRDRLTKLLFIPNSENDYVELMSNCDSLDDPTNEVLETASNNFFNLTMTRAQSQNARKRWLKMMEKSESESCTTRRLKLQPQTAIRYISEVDVKVMPFDCVIWPSVIRSSMSILDPVLEMWTSVMATFSDRMPFAAEDQSSCRTSRTWQSFGANLPLVYASCRSIRVFFPVNTKLEDDVEGKGHQRLWSRKEDVAIVGIGNVQISCQVENPLPRTLLDQDVYDAARHAGVLGIPGSDVEDRQYQMDICTVSLSTGVWQDITSCGNQFSSTHLTGKLRTMGENPAFEWNTIPHENAQSHCMIVLTPLMLPLDVRVAFAPAIICHGFDCPQNDAILVAGHSLEVNVSTDIVLNANISQLPLFIEIISQLKLHNSEANVEIPSGFHSEFNNIRPIPAMKSPSDFGPFTKETTKDSGVGSETSTFPLPTMSMSGAEMKGPKYGASLEDSAQFQLPCFEIFLTARRVSVSVFAILEDDLQHGPRIAKCEEMTELEKLPKSPFIHPLIHTIISQPHLFLHCYQQNQKLELCCYNISLRGSLSKIQLKDDCYNPKIEDFPLSWIETKPGNPNAKTGIPPALATVTLTDFYNPSIMLKLERPVKLHVSDNILNSVNFLQEILEITKLFSYIEQQQQKETNVGFENPVLKFRKVVAKFRKVDVCSCQIVFELIPNVEKWESVKLFASFEEVSGSFSVKDSLQLKGVACIVSGKIESQGFCLTIMWKDLKKSLLKHSSLDLQMEAVWDLWRLHSDFPRIMLKVATGALFVHLDKDIIKCLTELCTNLPKTDSSDVQIIPDSSASEKVENMEDNLSQAWHDDLRVGIFQYIQGLDDGNDKPNPYEIVFCKHKVGNAASMSWCYPQPRAITRVEINPVPFCTPTDDDTNDVICCILQYWEPLRGDYVSYRKFFLSETSNCTLDMPPVTFNTCKDIVIAHTWRVVMDFNGDDADRRTPFVSPLALAACLRVDSYFNPILVAAFEVLATVELLHLTIELQASQGKKTQFHQLQNFTADHSATIDREVVFFNLENIYIGFDNWRNWQKINASLNSRVEILEYRCLTKQVLIENFTMKLQAIVSKNDSKESTRQNVELTADASDVTIRVSQSAVHTLSLAAGEWKRDNDENDDDLITILNYYVVCNNTDETIRFGQENTEENIVLQSGQMHMYSWQSSSKSKKLCLSTKSTDWTWCEPFGIDCEQTLVRKVTSQGNCVAVNIAIKRLSNTQHQVVISGQLCITNRLSYPIEISLNFANNGKVPDGKESTKQIQVHEMSAGRSVIVEQSHVPSIRVSMCGENAWSKDIDLSISFMNATNDNIRIQLPSKSDLPFQEAWCNVIVRTEGQCMHLLVVFTPMYTVTVHFPFPLIMIMKSENDEELHRVCIKGRGCEHHIDILGDSSKDRTLCFQLNKKFEASKPDILLSTSLLSKMEKNTEIEDFFTSCSADERNSQYLWPYLDDDLESFLDEHKQHANILSILKSIAEMKRLNVEEPVNILDQPRVELEVFLTQRWPGCNTVAIDIKPWGLLVNQTGIDLIFQYQTKEWLITVGSTFSPPKLQESFKLAVYYYDQWHYSESMELDENDSSLSRYKPKVKGIICKGDCMQFNIKVSLASKVCLLSVEYKYKNGMTVLVVKPSYFVINNSSHSLIFRPLVALCDPGLDSALHIPENSNANETFEECNVGNVGAILLWNLMTSVESQSPFATTLCFICVALQRNCIGHSLPCKLLSADETISKPTVHQAVVPILNEKVVHKEADNEEDTFASLPLQIICCTHSGSGFIFVRDDIAPQFKLHNNCSFELYFGQSLESSGDVFTVYEEKGLLQNIPYLPAHSSWHYTFPSLLAKFPDISHDPMPLLRFSGKCFDGRSGCPSTHWSTAVCVSSEHELFLHIPSISDVKVRTHRHGAVMHVYIDPVSRVEVSAKEIRSRLKTKNLSDLEFTARKTNQDEMALTKMQLKSTRPSSSSRCTAEGHDSVEALAVKGPQHENSNVMYPKVTHYDIYITSSMSQVCLVIVDECCGKGPREVLRVSAQNLRFMYRPLGHDTEKMPIGFNMPAVIKEQMVICIGSLQLDNQLQFRNKYHFPVILVQQRNVKDPNASVDTAPDSWKGPNVMWQTVMSNSMLVVNVVAILDPKDGGRYLEDVVIDLKPIAAYVEDSLLYELSELLPTYVPFGALTKSALRPWTSLVPVKVQLQVSPLQFPVLVQRLRIEPINMLLSAHASMKVFLSLDSTPLNFRAFDCQALQTTVYHLGQVMTTHYLAGALIRAGWVIGSLDLLANPGGLVRAFGTGISDLVKMPYHGLMQGPFAFLAGCLFGSSSLMKHISAGALTSVTNLASSVSRNMDRLSLDSLHRERNEELRRQPPIGLAAGIGQGLTSLGFGVLGAVAGLVHHPMHNVQVAVALRKPATSVAQGIMSGVGKGLIGVVAKPIGGAAEFVSQTGQGLLYGVGWNTKLRQLHEPCMDYAQFQSNSPMKYACKMVPGCAVSSEIFAVDATCIVKTESYLPTILLLASEVLFVVNAQDDGQHQAYTVTEWDCGKTTDPTVLRFVPHCKDSLQGSRDEDCNRDRISEFIMKSSNYTFHEATEKNVTTAAASNSCEMVFYMSPRLRTVFLAMYTAAQDRAFNRGFCI